MEQFEKKIYSQNGEDGILNHIFERYPPKYKRYIEFGASDGKECNTRNLMENHGWSGLLLDGSNENKLINLHKEFITKDNIIDLFKKYNVYNQNCDLLVVDIDYNDFYVLNEILKNTSKDKLPSVIVVEYNASILPNIDKVVIYNEKYMWDSTNYFGASLLAYFNLMQKYNYSLVYCEDHGVNAFFIHNSLSPNFINMNKPEILYKPPKYISQQYGHRCDKLMRKYVSSDSILNGSKNVNINLSNIAICETEDYGELLYLKNDYYIAQVMKQNIVYEEDLIQKHLKEYIAKSNTILDIGAHIGSHSIVYNKINKNAQIHAFELQETMYLLLKQNIEHNKIKNVKCYNCAIGNKMKMIEINNTIRDGPTQSIIDYNASTDYNFGGVEIGTGDEEKMMITIDSLNLSACDFIKIDIEGFEYFAILGAINTIIKYHPIIFYENNEKQPTQKMLQIAEHNIQSQLDKDCVAKLLFSIGYIHFERIGMNILCK
jgi:FkbM family methyltransferase